MWFGIVSIFPEMFNVLKNYGISSYAYKNNIFDIKFFNPKLYIDKYLYNKPYGGGKGVIMLYHPLVKAINEAKTNKPESLVIYVSPKGKLLDNNLIIKLSKLNSIIFISGRYEEIDYRIIKEKVDLEVSLGDFVVSGGELPIMLTIDAILRLLPNVIKNADSINVESFNNSLLDYQQYTKPKKINNSEVPEVLVQGNHYAISKWRYEQRLGFTFLRRPDLLYNKKLSITEKLLLDNFIMNEKVS